MMCLAILIDFQIYLMDSCINFENQIMFEALLNFFVMAKVLDWKLNMLDKIRFIPIHLLWACMLCFCLHLVSLFSFFPLDWTPI